MHECSVSSPWFDHIRTGRKNVEGRLCKGTFATLRKGHLLTVHSEGDQSWSFETIVIDVRRYCSFKEYLEMEGLRRTLPGIGTVVEGIRVYRQFYSREQESEHGILAVELRRVK
jgi:ASC-1-like (ASCH) protein